MSVPSQRSCPPRRPLQTPPVNIVQVRVTNLTFKQDFSPPMIVVHEKVGDHVLNVMDLFFVWLEALPDQLTSQVIVCVGNK